jgi:Dynein light chain type 1
MSSSERKVEIRNYDMSEEMKEDAKKKAVEALHKFSTAREIAAHIKKVTE